MNWLDYRERLGIGLNDDHKLGMFKNIMTNKLPAYDDHYDLPALFYYANTIGERFDQYRTFGSHPFDAVKTDLAISDSIADYVTRFVVAINSCKCGEAEDVKENGEKLLQLLRATLSQCRIQYEVIQDDDGYFVFPMGVPEFDKALVSEPLLWLAKYPKTEKEWSQAIREYSSGSEPSDVADKFRRALERFFQDFFTSEKNLENLKAEYGQYLKQNGIPAEISGNLDMLLQQYLNFMNNHAKHHDNTSSRILEYIMYQTGNIIRLLIRLKDEENG